MTTYSLEAFAHVPRVERKAKPKPKAKSPTSQPGRCSGLTGVSSRLGDGWFSRLPRQEQEELALEMLCFAPRREEKGSGTYREALALFAGLVHHFGDDTAVDLCRRSGWEGEHWDLDEVAGTITHNANAAGIGTLIHVARQGGWTYSKPAAAAVEEELKTIEVHQRFLEPEVLPDAPLVAVISGLGTGKTELFRRIASMQKAIVFTHRRSLSDNIGARLDLPVLREGKAIHNDANAGATTSEAIEVQLARQEGCVVVIDSSGPGNSCEISPEDCEGAVVVIDEADQFLRHALHSRTEIEKHRMEVLANLTRCLQSAKRVVIASAHLDPLTIAAFERMAGGEAVIVKNTFKPAEGRTAVILDKPLQLLNHIASSATNKTPFIVHTDSAKSKSRWAPSSLRPFIQERWPEAKVLEITAATCTEKHHPAIRAMSNPALLHLYDVVLASPAIETGFSIEDPTGHFGAVFVGSTGHTQPKSVVQSSGRLRSNAIRYVYAPKKSKTRIGNGSADAAFVRRGLLRTNALLQRSIFKLYLAGDEIGAPGFFVETWARQAAETNAASPNYREEISNALVDEGYELLNSFEVSQENEEFIEELCEHRDNAERKDCQRSVDAPTVTPMQFEELEKRKVLTADERAIVERGSILKFLGVDLQSWEQVKAARDEARTKLLRRLLMSDPEALDLWAKVKSCKLTDSQRHFAPDMARHFRDGDIARRLALLLNRFPELGRLMNDAGSGATTSVNLFADLNAYMHGEDLDELADKIAWGSAVRQVLGINVLSAKTRPRTVLDGLLNLVGYDLSSTGRKGPRDENGKQPWLYMVEDTTAALNPADVMRHLKAELQRSAEDVEAVWPIRDRYISASPPDQDQGVGDDEKRAAMEAALAEWN